MASAPSGTLVCCVQRAAASSASDWRRSRRERASMSASAVERPRKPVRGMSTSTMKRVLPVLKTEISVVGHHKTGWMVKEELQCGMCAMLPHQDVAMVRGGAAALFDALAQEMPVDGHRRVQPQPPTGVELFIETA